MRPIPLARIRGRVGQHAACAQLTHAARARRRRHKAVGAAHQAVAPIEHQARCGQAACKARGVDAFQRRAAREHLRRVRHAGKVLEPPHFRALGERIEPVCTAIDAGTGSRRVDKHLLNLQLRVVPRTGTGRSITRDVNLERLHDPAACNTAPALKVVDLKCAVVKQQCAQLQPHIPLKREDRGRHLVGSVLHIQPVLHANGRRNCVEHFRGENPFGKFLVRLGGTLALLRAVKRRHSHCHLPRFVERRAAILPSDGVSDVGEDRRRDLAHRHQNTSSSNDWMLANLAST